MKEIISFIKMLIDGLIDVITMIPTAITTLTSLIGILPTFVVGVCTAAVGILVIYVLIGRGD